MQYYNYQHHQKACREMRLSHLHEILIYFVSSLIADLMSSYLKNISENFYDQSNYVEDMEKRENGLNHEHT